MKIIKLPKPNCDRYGNTPHQQPNMGALEILARIKLLPIQDQISVLNVLKKSLEDEGKALQSTIDELSQINP